MGRIACLRGKEKYGDLYDKWLTEPNNVKMPNGESLNDVRKRSIEAFNKIIVHIKEYSLLHLAQLISFVCYALDLDNCHFGK